MRQVMAKVSRVTTVLLVWLIVAACTAPQAPTPGGQVATATATSGPVVVPSLAPCTLQPVIAPTRPAQTPGYTELDPTTNLHMTGTPQQIDLAQYRLKVTGKVDRPLSLAYDELRCMPKIKTSDVLICPGFFEDVANWGGASLAYVLDRAGVQSSAASLTLAGADGYSVFVTLQQARAGNAYLAYEWEGQPLPILHGFPVRAVFPSLQGNKWVKWLVEIRVE